MKKIFLFSLIAFSFLVYGEGCDLFYDYLNDGDDYSVELESTGYSSIYNSYYSQFVIHKGYNASYLIRRYTWRASGTWDGREQLISISGSASTTAEGDCFVQLFKDGTSTNALEFVSEFNSHFFDIAEFIKQDDWTAIYSDNNRMLASNSNGEYMLFTKNPDGTFQASKPVGDSWESSGVGSTWTGDALGDRVANAFDSEQTQFFDMAVLDFSETPITPDLAQGIDNPYTPAPPTPDSSSGYDSVEVDRGIAVAVAEGTKEGFADVVRAVEGIEAGSGSVEVLVDVTVTNDFGEPPDDLWVPEMWENPEDWQIAEKGGMDAELASRGAANSGLLDEFLDLIRVHLTIPEYNVSFGSMSVVVFDLQSPGATNFSGEIDLDKFYVSHIRNFFLFLFGICSMFLIVRAIGFAWG